MDEADDVENGSDAVMMMATTKANEKKLSRLIKWIFTVYLPNCEEEKKEEWVNKVERVVRRFTVTEIKACLNLMNKHQAAVAGLPSLENNNWCIELDGIQILRQVIWNPPANDPLVTFSHAVAVVVSAWLNSSDQLQFEHYLRYLHLRLMSTSPLNLGTHRIDQLKAILKCD